MAKQDNNKEIKNKCRREIPVPPGYFKLHPEEENLLRKKAKKESKLKKEIKRQQTKELKQYLEEIVELPVLSPVEEKELIQKIEKGDKEAKNKLFLANLKLVISIAKKYVSKSPDLTLLDLIQEGELGLSKAIERFDSRKGYKFSDYATWWIRQAITRYIADLSRLGRTKKEREKAIAEIKKRTRQQSKELKLYLEKINKIPALTYEEKKQLWKKASKRDESAKKRLFEGHLKLVVEVAKDFAKTTGKDYPYLTILELIQEGEKGLWKTINKKGYADPYAIKHEMNLAIWRKTGTYPYVLE